MSSTFILLPSISADRYSTDLKQRIKIDCGCELKNAEGKRDGFIWLNWIELEWMAWDSITVGVDDMEFCFGWSVS